MAPRLLHTSRMVRDEEIVVNFPAAGESIMEGGLEAYEKDVGEFVEADETVRFAGRHALLCQ